MSWRSLIRLDRVDITLAWLVCILALPVAAYIYVKLNPRFVPIGIIVFAVALGYLLARRKGSPRLHRTKPHPRAGYALNATFVGLLGYSTVTYLLRPEAYVRPVEYYAAIALMAVVLFVEFAFVKDTPAWLGLVKAIAITMSLAWTESLLYSELVGVDPWYHQRVVAEILETGHPPAGLTYSGLPGMHYIIAGTMLATGLGYKMAALLSIGTAQMVANPVFAYLIGRHLYSKSIGLVAALMVAVASWHIMFSFWIIPNGFAMALILPIAYVVLRLSHQWSWWLAIASTIMGGIVIATHPIASVMLAAVLLLVWLGLRIYGGIRHRTTPARHFLLSGLIVAIGSVLYWSFVSHSLGYLIGLFASGFSYEYWGSPIPGAITPTSGNYAFGASWAEQLFNYMGMFLYFALAIMGCIVAVSKRLLSPQRAAYILAGLTILVVTFLGFVLQGVIIVGRWCYLSQVLLAVPLAVALIWMTRNSWRRLGATAILVFCLALMMIMSPQANMDNRTFGPNTIVRSAFTHAEVGAMEEAVALWDRDIAVDAVYYSMRFQYPGRLVDMSGCLAEADFTECRGQLVLIRDDIITNPCKVGEISPRQLTYDPRAALLSQGFVKVYDWGTVEGYVTSP